MRFKSLYCKSIISSFLLYVAKRNAVSQIYQRVICLSETSETRNDTRDLRESLRGRAPLIKTGYILENFGQNMDIEKSNAF